MFIKDLIKVSTKIEIHMMFKQKLKSMVSNK